MERCESVPPLLRFEVITIFPALIESVVQFGILRRARTLGRLSVQAVDLRDFAEGKHRQVDDYPYGGGSGMVLKPEPLFRAVRHLKDGDEDARVVYMTPQGTPLTQNACERLSLERRLIVLCGRYKGVDERAREALVDEEISVGDYILSGGELPALVLLDAVARVLPGVLSDAESALEDSFAADLLDAPHYTRPAEWEGRRVPDAPLSGDPKRIAAWKRKESLIRTALRRPDMLEQASLSDDDLAVLEGLKRSKGRDDESG